MGRGSAAPPISVVLPVRDACPFLPAALASLRAQTFADFEVLAQDDGSTDGSLDLLREAARGDPRVQVEAGPPRGVAAAANRAAQRARGALLVRMDADDRSRPGRLAALRAYAEEHPDVGWFGSRVRYFPRSAVSAGMTRYESWVNGLLDHAAIFRERFVEYPLPHPSTAIRREPWRALGGYREGPFPEDYELFLRAAERGVRFGKHEAVLLDWREGPHRTTKRDPRYTLAAFREVKRRHLVPLLRRLGRPPAVVGAGTPGRRLARTLAAAGLAPRWLVDPTGRRTGAPGPGADVLGPDDLARAAGCFLLVATGARGREEARHLLCREGLVEERDFLCVE